MPGALAFPCSGFRAFPCFVSGLLALPLCGAALTFFAAAKKDKQRKRLETPAKWVPQLAQGSGASGIWVRARAYACDKGVILPAALRAPKSNS